MFDMNKIELYREIKDIVKIQRLFEYLASHRSIEQNMWTFGLQNFSASAVTDEYVFEDW